MMGDNLPGGMHQTEKQDQRLASKLLTVVSELIETMAEALSEDREAARECVRNASAALLSCARGADESPDETFGAEIDVAHELHGAEVLDERIGGRVHVERGTVAA